MAISGDGRTAVTDAAWDTARAWEVATGKAAGQSLVHESDVRTVDISADGRMILTGGADGTARLWTMRSGSDLHLRLPEIRPDAHPFGDRATAQFRFSPDGRWLCGVAAQSIARIWNTETGKPQGPAIAPADGIVAFAFSTDSRTLSTTSGGGAVQSWQIGTGKVLDSATPKEMSADERPALIVAERTVRLRDPATGELAGRAIDVFGTLVAAGLLADGRTIFTYSSAGARFWDGHTGKPIGATIAAPDPEHLRVLPEEVVALSPDRRKLAAVRGDEVQVYRTPVPVAGDAEHLGLWAEVQSGMAWDENHAVRVLGADAWNQRRRQFDAMGGAAIE